MRAADHMWEPRRSAKPCSPNLRSPSFLSLSPCLSVLLRLQLQLHFRLLSLKPGNLTEVLAYLQKGSRRIAGRYRAWGLGCSEV